MGLLPLPSLHPVFFLFFAGQIPEVAPSTIAWAAPAILVSAVMIAWAAESAQYFIPQGFALAILAWLQTLPEFAGEAVLAWHQQVPLLLAGLTGALRLLTGLGWPVIYLTAAVFHRRRGRGAMRVIHLEEHHSVEVIGLMVPLIYIGVIAAKGTLTIWDGVILTVIYAAYLAILTRLPPEEEESVEELELIPRTIVTAPRNTRIAAISGLFLVGAGLIYFSAEPFVASLLAISTVLGIPTFIFVQWMLPLVSEFPEMASTIYFARTVERAPMALMNMVSSNINQWTLLVAMLPVVYSMSLGSAMAIPLDDEQKLQLLMTLGQAVVGLMFLINMELTFRESVILFVLFIAGFAGGQMAKVVTVLYFLWAGFEMYRVIVGKREPKALVLFVKTWKEHVVKRRG
jgi:cation:H+ antiporter